MGFSDPQQSANREFFVAERLFFAEAAVQNEVFSFSDRLLSARSGRLNRWIASMPFCRLLESIGNSTQHGFA